MVLTRLLRGSQGGVRRGGVFCDLVGSGSRGVFGSGKECCGWAVWDWIGFMLLGSVRSVMAVMVRCVAMGIGRDGCRAMWQDFCKGGVLSGLTRLGNAVEDWTGWVRYGK